MSCKLEPAIWSHDTDQQIPYFDRCQLIITWMSDIKEAHGKPRLQISVNLFLEYGRHVARLHRRRRRRRAYAPTGNTASHGTHKKINYYSFKIFPRFGLVETTRIIHHNQLLFTKFGKNLRHIQSMTSKVEPAAYYSTVDVNMTSKVEHAADYSTVDRKNLGTRLWFWWAEKQRAKRRNSIKNGEIFWMNNKAIIEFGFRRIRRILQISESVIHLGLRPLWITSSLICRILHILLSLIQ